MEEVSRQRIREVIGAALSLASIPFTESQLEAMTAGYFPAKDTGLGKSQPEAMLEYFTKWMHEKVEKHGIEKVMMVLQETFPGLDLPKPPTAGN